LRYIDFAMPISDSLEDVDYETTLAMECTMMPLQGTVRFLTLPCPSAIIRELIISTYQGEAFVEYPPDQLYMVRVW
jgi:hypothetical protein